MNNPLLFTDPSGYRPEALFEEEERMQQSGGGNRWADPFGWISLGSSYMQNYIASMSWTYYNGYHTNHHTGEVAYSNHEFLGSYTKEHGGSYDRYTIFETGASLDGGSTFVGNGNFGIIHEGIMNSDGMFPTFNSYKQARRYVNSLESERWLGNSKAGAFASYVSTALLETKQHLKLIDIGLNARNVVRIGGPTFAIISLYFSRRAYRNGEISAEKFMADIGISAFSIAGTIGTFAAIEYALIDNFYKGGIEGFGRDYSKVYSNFYNQAGFSSWIY